MIWNIYGLYTGYIWDIYGLSPNMWRIRCGVVDNINAKNNTLQPSNFDLPSCRVLLVTLLNN